jgi:hypothetical protein
MRWLPGLTKAKNVVLGAAAMVLERNEMTKPTVLLSKSSFRDKFQSQVNFLIIEAATKVPKNRPSVHQP